MPNIAVPPLERFWRHVNKTETCWLWTGTTGGTESTYGYFRSTTRQQDSKVLAHRWIYEQLVGPIPDGLELDHLCRVPLCVNPCHLEPVTHRENMRRARLSVCKRGHDLTVEANCRFDELGRRRGCIVCHREKALARFYAMKER